MLIDWLILRFHVKENQTARKLINLISETVSLAQEHNLQQRAAGVQSKTKTEVLLGHAKKGMLNCWE